MYQYNDILLPHVVILGSGSTIAAIPNGDKNHHKSFDFANFGKDEFFKDFIEKLPPKHKKDNLETLYLSLLNDDSTKELKDELDFLLRDKFTRLELPEAMTILDWLVLSLRDKDYIISFNWDPLLIQAYNRVRRFTENLPHILFPHGNVEACYNNEKYGARHNIDNINMIPSPLVYPVKERDSYNNIFLADQVRKTQRAICGAGFLTIFGYSGAETDETDVQLMKDIFMPNGYNAICNGVEIIGPPNKEELAKLKNRWSFLSKGVEGHYYAYGDFMDCKLAKAPRRSIESCSCWKSPTISLSYKDNEQETIKKFEKLIQNEVVNNYNSYFAL